MLKIKLDKLTGASGPTGWTQVFEYNSQLYIIVSASFPYPEIAARINEEYRKKSDLKPFNALKSAVEKAVSEVPSEKINVAVGATLFVDGTIYSAATGGIQVLIIRGGTVATIIASNKNDTAIASGVPKTGDKIAVGTKLFFEKISQNDLKQALLSPNLENIRSDEGGFGVMVCNFSEEEEGVEMAVPTILNESVETPPESKGFNPKSVLTTLISRVSKLIPERKLYVPVTAGMDIENTKNKKMTLSVGIILLAILVISIGFGIRQKGINKERAKYEGKLTQASHDIDEAVSLYQVSPDKARELFAASQDLLNQIEALDVKDKRIDDLKSKLDSERGNILGEYSVSPNLFLDLALLSSGFNGDSVSTSQGNLYVLDGTGRKAVSIELSTKKSAVVAGPDKIDKAMGLAAYGDRVFVLNDLGVKEVDGDNPREVIDKTWTGDALIYAYTGNLYVLDKGNNKIYRYAGQSDNSFGSPQDWLSKDTTVDFSGAKSWIIDGTIYVLTSSGKIAKFSQGSPQNFSITGVYPEVTNIDAIYTNEDDQDIYLLDKEEGRVIALDKTGKYVAQYRSNAIADAKGLVVSETDKKIILLTGGKLLSIDIKHL